MDAYDSAPRLVLSGKQWRKGCGRRAAVQCRPYAGPASTAASGLLCSVTRNPVSCPAADASGCPVDARAAFNESRVKSPRPLALCVVLRVRSPRTTPSSLSPFAATFGVS
uniref:Uncharacterized protein n=1 Tax=Plectus sambesii TaxID=2011161 RepID=A0A914WVF8_9BILA